MITGCQANHSAEQTAKSIWESPSTQNLSGGEHIDKVCGTATRLLGFLRRAMHRCPPTLKEKAYKAIVRPWMEYAVGVWDPHQKKYVDKLEMIQRRAARFVTNNPHRRTAILYFTSTSRFFKKYNTYTCEPYMFFEGFFKTNLMRLVSWNFMVIWDFFFFKKNTYLECFDCLFVSKEACGPKASYQWVSYLYTCFANIRRNIII